MTKFVFVVGGVYSGTGKGIATASLGLLLKLRNLKVQITKFDPYLNTDAGVLAPREHGETFVLEDGKEVDLDLGSYERITGIEMSSKNIYTSGTLYKELIQEQEDGKYLGKSIQIVPHVTDKIQNRLIELGKDNDVVFAEIGGTVGDIESSQFYESIRQFKQKMGDDVLIIMVAPILWVSTIEEFKTKPLQNSVKELQRNGLQPDMLLCRVDREIPECVLDKICNLTNVPRENIFDSPDVASIYEVPIEFYNRHLDDIIVDRFRLKRNVCKIHEYKKLIENSKNLSNSINLGIICKYDNLEAYVSLKEAIYHAKMALNVDVTIKWISAIDVENENVDLKNENLDAIIVPGGFDSRGINGKIKAITYARENRIPFLGICLGLQCAVIEFARNVCLLKADSLEFDKNTENPVVNFVKGQENLKKFSGTMRLGSYECELGENTIAYESYGKSLITERHRHRYEVNSSYEKTFKEFGLIVSGINPESGLIEIMELEKTIHPFFVGIQAHPEFKSKLLEPSALFKSLIQEAVRIRYGL